MLERNPNLKTTTATPTPKASLALRGLHWFMALAIAAALTLIYVNELYVGHFSVQKVLTNAHIVAGLSVLVLVPLRFAVHWLLPLPPITPAPPRWQARLEAPVHATLYLLMLATPVLGLLVAQSSGRVIGLFGLALPALIGRDIALSHSLEAIHENLALALLCLVAAHAVAALTHHLIRRDDTLKRMV